MNAQIHALPRAAAAADPEPAALIRSGLATVEIETRAIDALRTRIDAAFVAACRLMLACRGRVVAVGMGKSGHIARKIAATLASTGTPAFYVHPGEASHGDLGMIHPDDVIVALSWSGETVELADLVAYAKRFRIGLIGITANEASSLGRQADACLALPKAL